MSTKYTTACIMLYLLLLAACNETVKQAPPAVQPATTIAENGIDTNTASAPAMNKTTDFVPEQFVPVDTTYGDLNGDGKDDIVLLVKDTDKSKMIKNDQDSLVDRNRRGIVVLFRQNNGYQLAVQNLRCFSSENEAGGVYFPPELSIDVANGKLYFHYAHGRYGYWRYTFRYSSTDFDLIGYDASENMGPVVRYKTSINFLTRTQIDSENTNNEAESGEETFKDKKKKLKRTQPFQLSTIQNFDDLDVTE